jgi:hypothetical protein
LVWWRGPKLERPEPPLLDYLAAVCVVLAEPLPNEDAEDPADRLIIGYYRNFGLRSLPDRVRDLVEKLPDDGEVHWGETEWSETDPWRLDAVIQRQIAPVKGEGVWYTSGRVFFTQW